MASLATEGIQHCLQYFGYAPAVIITPYTAEQIKILDATIDDWAILQCSFAGKWDDHYPKHPLMSFF